MKKLLALPLLMLSACGSESTPPRPLSPDESARLQPADPRLADLYARACKGCHTVKDSLAPLTGDRTQWDSRWALGEDALVASAIQGKGGMPPGGQCFECSADDLAALIRFMAGRER